MTTRPSFSSLAPLPAHDWLHALADLFERAFLDLDRDDAPPLLLGVAFDRDRPPPGPPAGHLPAPHHLTGADSPGLWLQPRGDDAVRIHLKPVDGHPSTELVGWHAPDDWWCLGVATGGWAADHDPTTRRPERPSRSPTRRRIRLLQLVTRTGEATMVAHQQGADVMRTRWLAASSEHTGFLDDCLRCALRTPTAPPPASTAECWTLLWLDRLLADAAAGQLDRATWDDVARRHPVFHFVGGEHGVALTRWATDRLDRAGIRLAEGYPWERLHTWCARGDGPIAASPPHVMAWMDVGMWARHVLAHLPPLEDTLLDLHDLLAPDVYVRLVDTIEAWDLFAPEAATG